MIIGGYLDSYKKKRNSKKQANQGADRPGRVSNISTLQPRLAKARAARQPTGPAPTTTALRADLDDIVSMLGWSLSHDIGI
jgi:hypothetical protein